MLVPFPAFGLHANLYPPFFWEANPHSQKKDTPLQTYKPSLSFPMYVIDFIMGSGLKIRVQTLSKLQTHSHGNVQTGLHHSQPIPSPFPAHSQLHSQLRFKLSPRLHSHSGAA